MKADRFKGALTTPPPASSAASVLAVDICGDDSEEAASEYGVTGREDLGSGTCGESGLEEGPDDCPISETDLNSFGCEESRPVGAVLTSRASTSKSGSDLSGKQVIDDVANEPHTFCICEIVLARRSAVRLAPNPSHSTCPFPRRIMNLYSMVRGSSNSISPVRQRGNEIGSVESIMAFCGSQEPIRSWPPTTISRSPGHVTWQLHSHTTRSI